MSGCGVNGSLSGVQEALKYGYLWTYTYIVKDYIIYANKKNTTKLIFGYPAIWAIFDYYLP